MESRPRAIPWASVGLFFFNGLAILSLMGASAALLFTTVFDLIRTNSRDLIHEPVSLAIALVFVALLLLPGTYYSFQRIISDPDTQPISIRAMKPVHWIVLLAGWFLVLTTGQAMVNLPLAAPFLLPFLNILAIALPIVLLVVFGAAGLSPGSRLRTWGTLSLSMTAGPLIILTLEVLAIGIISSLVTIYLILNPELVNELSRMITRLSSNPSEQVVLDTIVPILAKPGTIFLIGLYFSLVVPLVEEAFKPIAVWLLADRIPTPVQGFVLGVISGAGFAIFESLGVTSGTALADWAGLSLARSGTSLLHMVTSGLMGWALISAWREKKHLHLGIVYLLVVIIHGTWNALSLAMGATQISETMVILPAYFDPVGRAGLAVLVGVLLVLMRLAGKHQRNRL